MSDFPVKAPPPPPPDLAYQAYGPIEDYGAPASFVHLKRFLAFLRKYWWVPVLTLIIALGAAITYVFWAPPTFVSTAPMWETEKMSLPGGALFVADLQNYLGTQIELLRSGKLRQLALARLQAAGTNAVPLGKDGKPVKVQLEVTRLPKSTVFVVKASSSNPGYVQAFLNALMNEYLDYKRNVRKLVSGDTLASISEQVLRLERDLKADQDAFTAFQRTNNLAILEEEGTIAGGYLARLKTQLSDLKLESQLLEAAALDRDDAGAGTANGGGFLFESVRSTGSASVPAATTERQTAFKDLQLLKIQREKLSQYLRPKHPKIVKLDGDIELGQRLIEMYYAQSREQLASSRQALKMRSESVLASIKEWEAEVVEANGRIAEAEHLKLNVSRTQSLYDRLLLLLQNVDISRNIDQETLAILEPASPALHSYKHEITVVGLAAFAGCVLGIAIVFLIEVRDDRFTSLIDVREQLTDNIVGQLPEVPKLRGKSPLPLLDQHDERHMYAESYRNLRSALLFLPVEGQRPKVILITSALPNEGKSTIAANLARTLTVGGSRVLLVDGDLRKGLLHDLMGMEREPGLSELLRQPSDYTKIIQRNSLANLAFISRGGHWGNPGDLFLGQQLDQLLVQWREQFDFVVIDSSPLLAADDASCLAPKVDATLFVVRRHHSSARAVREALELLAQRQARVIGVIFNGADASARSRYHYQYADYCSPANSTRGEQGVVRRESFS